MIHFNGLVKSNLLNKKLLAINIGKIKENRRIPYTLTKMHLKFSQFLLS